MKLRQFLLLALVGTLLGSLASGLWKWQQQIHPVATDENGPISQLPDFTLPDTEGNLWRAEEWRHKILVINFWATWCPPCVEEMPMLNHLARKYASQDVIFVGIAVDDADETRKFIKENNLHIPILLGEIRAMELMRQLGNRFNALPYTVVADHGGGIILRQFGKLNKRDLDSLLEKVTQGH